MRRASARILVGVALTASGLVASASGSAAKLLIAAAPPADAPARFAAALPATPPADPTWWASVGQGAGFAMSVLGGILTWVMLRQSEAKAVQRREADLDADARRKRDDADAAATRARELAVAMDQIKIFIARNYAEFEAARVRSQATMHEHLVQQDGTLSAIGDSIREISANTAAAEAPPTAPPADGPKGGDR